MQRSRLYLALGIMVIGIAFFGVAGYLIWQNNGGNGAEAELEALPDGETLAAIRLTVRESGLAGLSAETVDRLGLPYEQFSSAGLSLSRDGESVPFTIVGDGDEATLVFYAEAIASPAEASAVYWLNAGNGEAMAQDNALPGGLAIQTGRRTFRLDDNITFVAFATGDDTWFAQRLFAPSPLSSFDVPLESLAASGSEAVLSMRFWSNNQISSITPDHHLQATLNGEVIVDHLWDGSTLEEIELPIPAGLLQPSANTLTISLPGDTGAPGEDIYLDYLQIEFEGPLVTGEKQLYFKAIGPSLSVLTEWTDPIIVTADSGGQLKQLTNPEQIEGQLLFAGAENEQTYWVADKSILIRPELTLVPEWDSLRAAERGADYVAIMADAPGFAAATQPLLDHRQAQGLQVESVPVTQIYDEFGFGRQTPDAIRDFIAYAAANWSPAPKFVVLVGDASYDIHGFTEGVNRNLIPSKMIHTQFAGSVASDTWFTLPAEGQPPNIALGRFPVQTAGELTAIIDKIIAYEGLTETDWQRRALLVADDEPAFDNVSDALNIELSAAGYETDKLYMSENEDIHDSILNRLDEGIGLLNYVGHGSIQVWGDEQVLTVDDAEGLGGTGRYPIFTTFTCLNGYFNHPQVDALAESLLRVEDGGIVAAIAPSGRSLTNQQQPIADVFFNQLLTRDAATLGEALLIAKAEGADNEFLRDVIHTFNLLGDPALRFQHPTD